MFEVAIALAIVMVAAVAGIAGTTISAATLAIVAAATTCHRCPDCVSRNSDMATDTAASNDAIGVATTAGDERTHLVATATRAAMLMTY